MKNDYQIHLFLLVGYGFLLIEPVWPSPVIVNREYVETTETSKQQSQTQHQEPPSYLTLIYDALTSSVQMQVQETQESTNDQLLKAVLPQESPGNENHGMKLEFKFYEHEFTKAHLILKLKNAPDPNSHRHGQPVSLGLELLISLFHRTTGMADQMVQFQIQLELTRNVEYHVVELANLLNQQQQQSSLSLLHKLVIEFKVKHPSPSSKGDVDDDAIRDFDFEKLFDIGINSNVDAPFILLQFQDVQLPNMPQIRYYYDSWKHQQQQSTKQNDSQTRRLTRSVPSQPETTPTLATATTAKTTTSSSFPVEEEEGNQEWPRQTKPFMFLCTCTNYTQHEGDSGGNNTRKVAIPFPPQTVTITNSTITVPVLQETGTSGRNVTNIEVKSCNVNETLTGTETRSHTLAPTIKTTTSSDIVNPKPNITPGAGPSLNKTHSISAAQTRPTRPIAHVQQQPKPKLDIDGTKPIRHPFTLVTAVPPATAKPKPNLATPAFASALYSSIPSRSNDHGRRISASAVPLEKSPPTACRKHELLVKPSALKLDHVVRPSVIDLGYCAGQCPFPLENDVYNFTVHSYFIDQYRFYHGLGIPSNLPLSHCVPVQYKQLMAITRDDDDGFSVVLLNEASVTSCGCR